MGIKWTIFLFFLLPIFLAADTKLPPAMGNEIVAFTLFNYDNLIADSYENDKSYLKQLAYLLSKAAKITEAECLNILQSPDLRAEPLPVAYMLKLNRKIRASSGFYFVDTDD
ncbi:MAG: hypothetical protein LBK68_08145 [Candidatus Margulisbacteria bacterium]|jgi:predicted membrane chloride channel (bestrophin family)|nr:hypothetical protein [Candidatus Margulisiibacteriota bacterium]